MPEYIYIASSEQFPGIVKIGRTDREVSERMAELSSGDYGPEGHFEDATWTAEAVVEVKDNAPAESAIHDHWADARVSPDRELFYTDDPEQLAEELVDFTGGNLIAQSDITFEVMDTLLDVGVDVTGIGLAAKALFWLMDTEFFDYVPYSQELRKSLSVKSGVIALVTLVSLGVLAINLVIFLFPIAMGVLIIWLMVLSMLLFSQAMQKAKKRLISWLGF